MTVNVWTRKQKTKRMILGGRGGVGVVTEAEITRWQFCNSPHTAIDSEHHNHHSAATALLFWIVQSDHHTQCNHRTKSRTMWTCAVHKVPHIMERNRNGNSAPGKGNVMPCKAILRWGTSILRRGRQGSAKAKARQTCLRHTPSATPPPPQAPLHPLCVELYRNFAQSTNTLAPFFPDWQTCSNVCRTKLFCTVHICLSCVFCVSQRILSAQLNASAFSQNPNHYLSRF